MKDSIVVTPAPAFTDPEWEQLESQLGFGNLNAPLWFLGMEEGLCEKYCPLDQNLRWRIANFPAPISSMTTHLTAPWLGRDPTTGKTVLPRTKVWPIMAKIAHLLLHTNPTWNDTAEVEIYIRRKLGTTAGETLMLELLPLPSPKLEVWPSAYVARHKTRDAYMAALLNKRIDTLRALVKKGKPTWLLCFGSKYWQHYKRIVPDVHTWTVPNLIHAQGKRRIRIEIGTTPEGTKVILTPFFGYRSLSERIIARLPTIAQEATAEVAPI